MYAQVVFPLPFRKAFTYNIPYELEEAVKIGVRVVAPFGRRILTGFVVGTSLTTSVKEKIKNIHDVLDEEPIFDEDSVKFYEWIADYYISSLGEALKNTVPYGSDVESKRRIVADTEYCKQLLAKEKKRTTTRAKLLQVLSEKETATVSYLQKSVGKKSIYSVLKTLEKEEAITVLNQIDDPKVRVKKLKFVKLVLPVEEVYEEIPLLEDSAPKQVVILLELISHKGDDVQLSELLKRTHTSQSSVNGLADKGLVEVFDKEVERTYTETYEEARKQIKLTQPQQEIVDKVNANIIENKFTPYLLHGVTGSGKTQVYIELAKTALKQDKNVLILVPEISLTPQITSRFYNTLGDKVAVMHSRMSLGERYDTWRGIVSGKYRLVIGPRSALFAPLRNLGLIVVDEEHDQSYKQHDVTPKYNARDAAVMKAQLSSCPVVLGSATPSLESMHNAQTEKYTLLELKDRVDNAKLPRIRLVDATQEQKKKRMESTFSKTLLDTIAGRLRSNESVIVLQNRRGYSTQVYCTDCGTIETCPDCSVPMVYHMSQNYLKCHYCNITTAVPKACKNCGSLSLKYLGMGTQKVEDELEYYFPQASIERVDSDSMSKKGKLGITLNRFRKGEIDILLGTQMVAKGLDFPRVTLVGVVSAETTLWLPDFRADERTFQLLTQVAGRAGRSENPGEVLIQTRDQKHFVLQKVLMNDYKGFYENELALRKQGGYPPFAKLGLIEVRDEDEDTARKAINEFHTVLEKHKKSIEINGPAEAPITRIKKEYRYQILLKAYKKYDPSGRIMRNAITESIIEFNRVSRYRDVKLVVDIDPQSII